MSADLYAAFVAAGTSEREASNGISGNPSVNSTSSTSPETQQNFQPVSQVRSRPQPGTQKKEPQPLWRRDLSGTDVLFDAEEPEADDDFGAFETVSSINEEQQPVELFRNDGSQPLLPDLLDEQDSVAELPTPSSKPVGAQPGHRFQVGQQKHGPNPASWDDDWGDFEQIDASKQRTSEQPNDKTEAKSGTVQDSIVNVPEDEWEPFEDGPSAQVQASIASRPVSVPPRPDNAVPSQALATAPSFERPTNIPPPSSMLQLLSTVFETIHNDTTNQTKPTPELASQIMIAFRTASRIVAGRTLRWKRDTILAQSVRVGQAGKSGGMKLASLTKNETTKEQRDSEEMIHDWSKYVHEFKSVLAQAHLQPYRLRISASPSLQTLKYPNTPNSSKQCALCGLKRTERLTEVDIEADDIFGEFWTEHWGHKDCYDFWYTYKDLLSHR